MRLPTLLRPWRLLPAYAISGIEAALGIGCIQALATLAVGSHVAHFVVSGAVCASIADLPNVATRTVHRVGAAVVLSAAAALVVDLLRSHPLGLGLAVALVSAAAMMTLAWGARAGAVSFTPILSMIFSMAVPPTGHPVEVAAWSACGSLAYLGWALLAGAACQRRYRSLVLAAALRAAAELFRSRAAVLGAVRSAADAAGPLRSWVSGESVLADRLQAARDLLFPAPESPRWCRQVAILLRVIDLRDLLLASRLDAHLLGDDATGRAILERITGAMGAIAERLDRAADHVRDDTMPGDASEPPLDLEARFRALPVAADDPRLRLVPSIRGRMRQIGLVANRIGRLLQGHEEALPLTRAQLQLFVAPEGWPTRALRPHGRRDSLVLRHAIRMGLALGAAYYLALALPWGSHPYWLVLSVAVVLRGSLGETLARRNARVFGTVLGCLVVVALSHVPSEGIQGGVFLVAVGTAHTFATQRYWLTATAASVMALLQSHLVDPAGGYAIAERVADTFLGALLAWCFSYVLPSWERRRVPEAIARALRDLKDYAAHSLGAATLDPVEERMARRRAYDSLAALAAALQRSAVEPRGVRLPAGEIAALLDYGERFMAHLSAVRLTRARLRNEDALSAQVDRALQAADAALAARLDLRQAELEMPAEAGDGIDLLPERPAAEDVMPWLERRLLLIVDEAGRIRAAAQAGLAG